MFLQNNEIDFPPVETADEDGLLAMGGRLDTPRLLNAYRHGIFPWYEEASPVLWWCPDPRFVLYPYNLKVSKSMRAVINHHLFDFSVNKDFGQVIEHCRIKARKDQPGTWITSDVVNAYTKLHELGYAYSVEAWMDGILVGGLYGIRMGRIFFGESMFSDVSNASKFAFIKYVEQLKEEGIALIDCQVYTGHLESLGAEMISRKLFLEILEQNL